jgi:proton-coupled amino acid transporter
MLYENLFRIVLVVFTFSLAVNVPRIDLFISLVGAIASSTLAIIIPPILDIIVFYEASNRSKVKLVKNILIIIFGFYIFIAGTWVSVNDIIEYLRHR